MAPGKVKILLIDDSTLMLRYLADLLGRAGYEVVTAQHMVDAVGVFSETRPQAVLCDFVLGSNQTGLEVVSAIFSLAPGQRPITAILTQGQLSPADEQRAASWKVRILQKPQRGHEQKFLDEIRAWLLPEV